MDHPIFGTIAPDPHKAYVEFDICASLPNIHGPESGGKFFCFHPAALGSSYVTLLHQQTNIGHTLKRYGGNQDRVNGCVVNVAYPDMPYGGWKIGTDGAKAPRLKVLAVVSKLLSGVPEWIGSHLGGKSPQSVSIEATPNVLELYDPRDQSFTDFSMAEQRYPGVIKRGKNAKGAPTMTVGKDQGTQLAFALGGSTATSSPSIQFQGVGYTPTPAEKTAKITTFRAEAQGEDEYSWIAASIDMAALFSAGKSVIWKRKSLDDAGGGVIRAVMDSGKHSIHGINLLATVADPLLEIYIPKKKITVLRYASSVSQLD
jgi:hypothetical protein